MASHYRKSLFDSTDISSELGFTPRQTEERRFEQHARLLLEYLAREIEHDEFDINELIDETGELPGCGCKYTERSMPWHDANGPLTPDAAFSERVHKMIDHLVNLDYLERVDIDCTTRYVLTMKTFAELEESELDNH